MFPYPPLNSKNFPPPPLPHTILSLTRPSLSPSFPSPASSFPSPAPFSRHYFPHTKSAHNEEIHIPAIMQSSIITSIIVIQLSSNSLQCERHCQQQSSYPVNFSAGKPSTILRSPAEIPQQHFSHPRVPSIFISLPAGNPHILFP